MAEKMAQVINAGDAVHLGLNDLQILVSSPHEKAVRLPIWNGISIKRMQDFALSSRIIEARIETGMHTT
jgi:hypothetical protein